MNWLARLKKTETGPDAYPTKPTKPPFVGFVGTPAGAFENSGAQSVAANDATPDPDRWCWPHSTAMNSAEIDAFMVRLSRFTDKGLNLTEAEALADKLVIRDRDADDRRLCLECANVRQGGGMWGCSQWQRAGLGAGGLAADMVRVLQRCDAFKEAAP
jgi:hypothetical protein